MKERLILIVIILLCTFVAFGTQAQTGASWDTLTRKTNKSIRENRRINFPKQRKIRYIYKKSVRNVLYGNPCADQITRKMGFGYSLDDSLNSTFKSEVKRNWNNLGTKFRIMLKNGLWWKFTLNRRLKRCVQYSGDRTG